MKKVGIITTFRQPNWGSVLQAYALQKTIEKQGFNVEVIDYQYPNEFHWERGLNWGFPPKRNLKTFFKHIITNIMCTFGLRPWSRMLLLNEFIRQEMKVSETYCSHRHLHESPPYYDIYVSGSDQIWNPYTMLGDMSYMFDFVANDCIKISYASSFSCLTLPDEYKKDYYSLLKTYKAISVRENNGRKIIQNLLGQDAKVVLDPTLLLNKSEWQQVAIGARKTKLPEQYILCYMLAYTFDAEEPMSKLLSNIQKKYKMPIIALRQMPKNFRGNEYRLPKSYNKGIREFLYLIENASIIVSSSFHGTAFALNYGKPLVALTANNEDDRVLTIMNNLNLSDHLCVLGKEYDEYEAYYDCEQEQQLLEQQRRESIQFLIDNL